MSSTITTDPVYTTGSITSPSDGDDLDAAVVTAAFQLLGDRADFARTALIAHIVWSKMLAVAPGGSLTSFSISVGAIMRLAVADSNGKYWVSGAAATSITQTKIEGGGGTLGALARWWYVYAFLTTAGAVDYAISLTAPDTSLRFKGGDVTRVYLGCFPTDTTGAPVPLQAVGGRYLYRRSGITSVEGLIAANGLRVLSISAVQGAFTAIDLTPVVPPHSRIAILDLQAIGDAAPDTALLTVYSDTDTASAAATAYTIDDHPVHAIAEVITSSAQVIKHKFAHGAAGALNGYIDALGFVE